MRSLIEELDRVGLVAELPIEEALGGIGATVEARVVCETFPAPAKTFSWDFFAFVGCIVKVDILLGVVTLRTSAEGSVPAVQIASTLHLFLAVDIVTSLG